MNVWLLYRDSEYGNTAASMNKNEIIQDLNLDVIFKTMARNDKYIYNTVRTVIMNSLTDIETIQYRQAIIEDCIHNFNDFTGLYEMVSEAIEETNKYTEATKKASSVPVSNAMSVLNSLELLGILVKHLENLKSYCDKMDHNFQSPGRKAFYDRLVKDINVRFVQKIKDSITKMNFLTEGGEITFSASLGQGLKFDNIIVNYLVKEGYKKRKTMGVVEMIIHKIFSRNMVILDDTNLARDAREMEAAGLAHILKMYQKFIKELSSFFECLRYPLAFYIGCANLYIRFQQLHIPTSMPVVTKQDMNLLKFKGLYDMSLAIYSRKTPVCNDLATEDKKLYIITGANQGGKSTFLRSLGVAQLLMQAGMFVPASYYCNRLYDGIFTHFTRREDVAMNSGKLDEELKRMSDILDEITPNSLLLLNESFATTTEREGSAIASDVVRALYENGTHIFMVTHLFEFTKATYDENLEGAMFLSAERLADGTRTYRILEKVPEKTSYGLDLYNDIITINI